MPSVMQARPIPPMTFRIGKGGYWRTRVRPVHAAIRTIGATHREARVPLVVRLRSAVTLLGRHPALAGVDLDVADREVVLLSGANGAGKTTLLRLLAGLVPLSMGEGAVLGRDLASDRRGARRELALVGHAPAAYDDLTVAENLRFVARAAGVDSPDDAAAAVGIERMLDVRVGRMSAGQRRRLGLALALARRPRLLLLDEPHAGLDEPSRAALDAVITGAAARSCTVLLSSHELERTRSLATREVVLANGRTVTAPAAAVRA
jgi:heme ABC exporter ATP-binding subunit CcmA